MNRESLIIILVGAGLSAGLFAYTVLTLFKASSMLTRQRLRGIRRLSEEPDGSVSAAPVVKLNAQQRLFESLGKVSEGLKIGQNKKEKQRIKLQRAVTLMKPEELNGLKILSAIIFGLVLFLAARQPLQLIAGLTGGFAAPDLIVQLKLKRRAKRNCTSERQRAIRSA